MMIRQVFVWFEKTKVASLYTLNYAKAVSAGVDPIGKKPLSHFNPGALSSVSSCGWLQFPLPIL